MAPLRHSLAWFISDAMSEYFDRLQEIQLLVKLKCISFEHEILGRLPLLNLYGLYPFWI